ncbi:hypothetical protein GCM10023322_83730 [Rugosimonospora acidiphila]|uniref:Uncharacterized protein n=1 Tax=Rugosimonospora acidiphila TaxID=556531 RepID=A0ABP9SW47_9ACTN
MEIGGVETVAEFVRRTEGPAVPFVPEWYPWVYAHHYLRLEAGSLPERFRRGGEPISLAEAEDLVYLWCGLSGEGIQRAARALADAYLRRWGMVRSGADDERVGPAARSGGRVTRRQSQTGRVPGGSRRTRRAPAAIAPDTRSA